MDTNTRIFCGMAPAKSSKFTDVLSNEREAFGLRTQARLELLRLFSKGSKLRDLNHPNIEFTNAINLWPGRNNGARNDNPPPISAGEEKLRLLLKQAFEKKRSTFTRIAFFGNGYWPTVFKNVFTTNEDLRNVLVKIDWKRTSRNERDGCLVAIVDHPSWWPIRCPFDKKSKRRDYHEVGAVLFALMNEVASIDGDVRRQPIRPRVGLRYIS